MQKTQQQSNQSKYKAEYIKRINRTIDYIEDNLDKSLPLEKIAHIACFSPYHFHRIFSAITGEPLAQFIQRLRIERAADKLIRNINQSITEIAFNCGFSSSAVFARVFKATFGVNAGEWRKQSLIAKNNTSQSQSKIDQSLRKIRQDISFPSLYIETNHITHTWRIVMKSKPEIKANVTIQEIPQIQVAYLRYIGPYAGNESLFKNLFDKLTAWAGARDLIHFPGTKFLTIYHDNPDITDKNKLRTDVCITVPMGTPAEGEIGMTVIPAGKNAVAHLEIFSSQYSEAWNAVYGGWMPESGYEPDDRPCYELYANDPKDHPEGKYIIDIYAPVKPLKKS